MAINSSIQADRPQNLLAKRRNGCDLFSRTSLGPSRSNRTAAAALSSPVTGCEPSDDKTSLEIFRSGMWLWSDADRFMWVTVYMRAYIDPGVHRTASIRSLLDVPIVPNPR